MDLGGWLRNLGLGQYEATFRANEIDTDVLPELTETDLLEKLGVPLGHWFSPRGDEINHSFTIRAQAGIGEGSDLGGRYGIPHLLVSQNLARDRNRHRNGRRHPGEVTVLQSQRRLFLLPRDTRAQRWGIFMSIPTVVAESEFQRSKQRVISHKTRGLKPHTRRMVALVREKEFLREIA
jgi:hypothetical protein